MDYWNGPLGELSKYVCVAKTEHRRFLLLCSLLVCVFERAAQEGAMVKSLEVQQDSLYS